MLPLVQLQDITFQYDEEAVILKQLNFEIKQNSFVSLLGPSGCGKSTLLNIIAGFLPATAGSVNIRGEAVKKPSKDRGFVFQDLALFPWLTVYENVEFGLKMQKVPKEKREQKVVQLIELVGLKKYTDFSVSSLSGGMRQRVALARTLAPEPNILLLDEPFSALDAQTRDDLQEELLSLHKNLKMTTVLVTHSIDEAVYLSDTVILLSKNGTIKEIVDIHLDEPRDRTSANYNDYEKKLYDFLRQERQRT